MSITDAKDTASWQIGFEDGIKFSIDMLQNKECGHCWLKSHEHEDLLYCCNCSIQRSK